MALILEAQKMHKETQASHGASYGIGLWGLNMPGIAMEVQVQQLLDLVKGFNFVG